ncbi:MAG TPA: hypothetical protein VGR10_07005, partial [Thermoleophilaceae bacterium]|nr:hypothetical protein [Thermoleophilaceae bacterium]
MLALGAAACGGGEERTLLTEGRSETLLSLLDEAEQQFQGGECDSLSATLEELQTEIEEVSDQVSQDLRTALSR